jgi:hypothetical protein
MRLEEAKTEGRCLAVVKGRVCPNPSVDGGMCSEHADLAGKHAVVGLGLVPAEQPDEPEPIPDDHRRAVDVRGEIRDEAEASVQAIRDLLREALRTEKVIHQKCPKCSTAVPFVVPDWSARLRALELMLAEGFGKPPAEDQRSGLSAGAAQVLADFEAMTDEQLAEIIAAG